ncbi:MAG: aminotransferase [Alphaproteobacteria bacterium]
MRSNIKYDTKDLWTKDKEHVLHAWSNLQTVREKGSLVVAEADGIYVWDSDGNKMIDGPAGMWCINIGYGRDEMADAIAEQVRRMPYFSPFHQMTSPPTAELGAKIAELAPGDLNEVFFTTGGSTAVDSAIRFVWSYHRYTGSKNKKHIISRLDSYHGSTYLTASVCGKMTDRSPYFDYITDQDFIHHLPSPYPYRRPEGTSLEEFCDEKVADLENKILELGSENVACFIAEPILASGGVIIPPPGYHKRTLEICRKYDVIYISDEVVTAFGRLGHFFASEPVYDIVPDIITCAKGLTSGYLPLGALIISERLFGAVAGAQAKDSVFANGFTYSGHPVAAAAGLKNIEIMEREKICEHVREVGPYFMERLESLYDLPMVGEVRGSHLMACVECVANRKTKERFKLELGIGPRIDMHCQKNGLIVRPFEHFCVLSPPLVITKEEIDEMVRILREGMEATMNDLRREGLWDG